ncbi:MAG: chemotaxis protein CheW [Clostridiales Family XIII bacterium]|nr:chemotaxis protein CheW [Clostridiales Family XIII bacterium]
MADNNIENRPNIEEDTQRGRYLTFTLAGSTYGVAIRYVIEIVGVGRITKVPNTPAFIKGITNLRGKIIPLVDVRLKFGRPEIPYTERTCVIVADVGGVDVGLIVDRVDDVIAIPDESIAAVPEGRVGFEDRFIESVGDVDGKMLFIVDMEVFVGPSAAETEYAPFPASGGAMAHEETAAPAAAPAANENDG